MIEKNNTQRLWAHFCQHPTSETHLRELARQLTLSMPAIIAAVEKLKRENLITVRKTRPLTLVKANLENKKFVQLKRICNLEQLYESGLVEFLTTQYNHPQAIVCFGSYARGEDTEQSDIDIAIIGAAEKKTDLIVFEKKLKRTIALHHFSPSSISEEFKTNLANGIVLEGSL